MLFALRPLSIGDHVCTVGDPIPPELAAQLPRGRADALREQRRVMEVPDEQLIEQLVEGLAGRLEHLEKVVRDMAIELERKTAEVPVVATPKVATKPAQKRKAA